MDAAHKRSIVLLGHAQAGKTSLAESILYVCKATARKGRVEEGTTVSDYSFDEIERRSSINLSLLQCEYKGCRIQIVDTPGYADFLGEALAAVRAADAGVIVVDAAGGVEAGTERAWQMLEDAGLPCVFFVNKTDKPGTDARSVLSQLQDRFSPKALPVDHIDDPVVVEAIAESDDALTEKFIEQGTLPAVELSADLMQAVDHRKFFPVIFGSASGDAGVIELLNAVVDDFPTPLSRPALRVKDPANHETAEDFTPAEHGPFAAFVFKNISDPYVGQLTLLRILRGSLASNTGFFNAVKKSRERIGQIYLLQGKEQRPVEAVSCGDIAAIAKLKEAGLSDTLCDERNPVLFEPIVFPAPMISASVKPKSREDEARISQALHKLCAEDPTFSFHHDPQTKELIISGLGNLHLDVMVGRMRRRFNVEVELGIPKVSYRETIGRSVNVQGKFKRQSGGHGQYGDVWIEVQPLDRGMGLEFVDKIVGGAVPRNFIPSVEKGVRRACEEGAVAGFPVVDLRVTLYDGSYHDVDSSDMAFQIAGAMAVRKAVVDANPMLLEPVMDVEVTIPEEHLGAISGDINSRRGRIIGMEVRGKTQIIRAQAPLAEMFKYANDLRSLTGGRGGYIMRFSHYEEVPHKIASGIISQYQASKKQEE